MNTIVCIKSYCEIQNHYLVIYKLINAFFNVGILSIVLFHYKVRALFTVEFNYLGLGSLFYNLV